MSGPLRLICLDLDNTLWDGEQTLRHAEAVLGAWLCQHFPERRAELDSERLRARRLALSRRRPQLLHRLSALRRLSLRQLLREFGRSQEQSRREAETAFGIFLDARHQITLYDGAEQVLAQLARHYRLAALSNGNAELRRLPCARYFDFALRAEELPHGKPHHQAFAAVRHRAGLPAHQIVHVGDDPADDVQGALRAGFRAIWVNFDGSQWRAGAPQPDGQMRHWRELPNLVNSLQTDRR